MIKYFKILKILIRNSIIRDSKIPGFIVTQIIQEFISITVTVVFFQVIFANTRELGGWSYYQVLFLYFYSKFIIHVSNAISRQGLKDFSQNMVKRGDYDFYLLKPVDSMVLVSMSKPAPIRLITAGFYVVLTLYSFVNSGIVASSVSILWFLFLSIVGYIIYYFLAVLTSVPAFWWIKVWSLPNVMARLGEFMRYPVQIFSLPFQIALFVFFPILAVSYIPTRSLFYPPEARYIIYMVLISLIFYFVTRSIWRIGEKNYSSASS